MSSLSKSPNTNFFREYVEVLYLACERNDVEEVKTLLAQSKYSEVLNQFVLLFLLFYFEFLFDSKLYVVCLIELVNFLVDSLFF